MIVKKENDGTIHVVDRQEYVIEVNSSFQKKLLEARANREERKRKLIEFLNDPEVQAYYNNPENILY